VQESQFGTANKTVTGSAALRGSLVPRKTTDKPVLGPWLQFFQPCGAIGFHSQRQHNPEMTMSGDPGNLQKRVLRRLFLAGLPLLATTWSLVADTPGRLHALAAPGCYCRCAPSRGLGSCVKMCELPRYASRWWAVSCAKPHRRSAGDNPGAGPRLHHRDRAEHAQL